jgi:hypothetical protein
MVPGIEAISKLISGNKFLLREGFFTYHTVNDTCALFTAITLTVHLSHTAHTVSFVTAKRTTSVVLCPTAGSLT